MTGITSRALTLLRGSKKVAASETRQSPTTGLSVFLSGPASVPAPFVAPPRIVRPRGKLVFGFDATGSRSVEWDATRRVQDVLFTAVPGELDVALAVHGGGKLHTFTPFLADSAKLRQIAAGIRCQVGGTRLLDILQRVPEGVGTVVYIGDSFEESPIEAMRLADALKARGTRVIILFDGADNDGAFRNSSTADVFADIAARTDGAVLPFDISAVGKLRDLLAAVAVLAVGGVELLEAKQSTMPGATLLLEHLGAGKRNGRR